MADEYKALTYINLPFLDGDGRLYRPGQTISLADIEESVEAASAALGPDHETISAADQIAEMIQYGTLSEDMDAPLNAAHLPPQPGSQSIETLIAEAKALAADYESRGEPVPPEVAALAEATAVDASDAGTGGTT